MLATSAWADFDSGLRAHDRRDHALALWEWLLSGFDGSATAQFNVGASYYNGDAGPVDYPRAAEWYARAAAQGHVGAQFLLGLMHHVGRGVPQDSGTAARWFRAAAAQGHVRAQHSLGVLYRTGRGVPQDLREAGRWFLRAAEQGYASAQVRAGVMYATGEGVAPDVVEAYAWYTRAAERFTGADREEIAGLVRELRARMSDAQVAQAQERARAWAPRPENVDRAAPVWPRALLRGGEPRDEARPDGRPGAAPPRADAAGPPPRAPRPTP
jgi:TPR repeat protein